MAAAAAIVESPSIADLLHAGEAAGCVRPDLDPNDILLLMGAIWRTGPGEEGEQQTRRLLSLLLDGLRTQSDTTALTDVKHPATPSHSISALIPAPLPISTPGLMSGYLLEEMNSLPRC